MHTVTDLQGECSIADAYKWRRRQGETRNAAFGFAVDEFCARYPEVPRADAAELVRFLLSQEAGQAD